MPTIQLVIESRSLSLLFGVVFRDNIDMLSNYSDARVHTLKGVIEDKL